MLQPVKSADRSDNQDDYSHSSNQNKGRYSKFERTRCGDLGNAIMATSIIVATVAVNLYAQRFFGFW